MRITVWQRFNPKKNAWEHNHVSEGWGNGDFPTPKSELQKKSWPKGVWKKKFGYLTDNTIIYRG